MSPKDLNDGIKNRIEMFAPAFMKRLTDSNGEEFAKSYRSNIEAAIIDLDAKITPLYLKQPNSGELLTDWAATMAICLREYGEIDKNLRLSFSDWDLAGIVGSMTFLEALKKTTEFILLQNGIL